MKRSVVCFLLVVLVACQKQVKSVENNEKEMTTLVGQQERRGPVVMPVDPFFRSLRLLYTTPEPESTYVRFTMTGNIDWHIERERPVRLHQIVFDNVEEEVRYTFLPGGFSSNQRTSIQTAPVTKRRGFRFGLVRVDAIWTNEEFPAFTVMVSDNDTVDENIFWEFYARNEALVHSTILCPTFGIALEGERISAVAPWYLFSYGIVMVIVLKKKMPVEPLFLYLSKKEGDENVIVAVDFSAEEWQRLSVYKNEARLLAFDLSMDALLIDESTSFSLYSYRK